VLPSALCYLPQIVRSICVRPWSLSLQPIEHNLTDESPILNRQLAEAQRFLQILLDVADLGNSTDDPIKFLEGALTLICSAMGKQLAIAWLVDREAHELQFCCVADPTKIQTAEFIETSRNMKFHPGVGLPGRALQEGKAVWVPNISRDANMPRLQVAARSALKSGFAIAVKDGERPVAVLEFFSRTTETVDEQTLQFLDRLGGYLGAALGRKLKDQRLREVEDSFKRELAARENTLNAIIDNMAEAIFFFDNGGKLVLTNAAGRQLLGGSMMVLPDDLRNFQGIYLPDAETPFPQDKLPLTAALRGEASTDVEMYVKSPNAASGAWLSASCRPLRSPSGDITGAVLVARDNTAARRLQQQLKTVADEAIASAKLKTEFVANVSHEIRTPLAGILGMAELLTTREESDQESRDIAAYVLESAQNLLEIVSDLLDFSKLEAGKLRLSKEHFSVGSVLQDVAMSISVPAKKKGLEVIVEQDDNLSEQVTGDQGRLLQVLLNFAHNSVKFTEKGTITLKAELKSRTPDVVRVMFSVTDTGIGIKPNTQEALFEPFVQGDGSATRRYGGTGLGLSIAKKLTSLMGGEIGMQSELGKGSIFWVTIPFECNDANMLIG
jgi:PAS domain S-box-containing protein